MNERNETMMKKLFALLLTVMMFMSTAALAEYGDNPTGKVIEWSQGEKVMKHEKQVVAEVFPELEYDYVLVNNNDFLTKLMAAVASNLDVPDIISCEVSNRGALFAMDILEDLEADPYNYDRNEIIDAVLPGLLDSEGRLVSLDNQYCPSGFVYRVDLTEKYFGVTEPEDVYELIKDWDSFIATGLKLKEAANGEVFMMQSVADLAEMICGQTNAEFIDGDNIDITGRYLAAFETAKKIQDAGVPLGLNEKNSTNWNAAYTNGSVIFFNHASWSTNSCISSNDSEKVTEGLWRFCQCPETSWLNGGTSQGIYSGSQNKEGAWGFIKYFKGTTEGYASIYEQIGWIPSFKSFYEGENSPVRGDFLYSKWYDGQNICAYIYDNIGTNVAPYETFTQYSTTVSNVVKDARLQMMINPNLTAQELVDYVIENVRILEPTANVF